MADAPDFASLGLPAPLAEAIAARGLTAPTQVQVLVRDRALAGRDLLVSSRTGSGKTLAFGFLVADTIARADGTVAHGATPRALVLAPTRELAVQVQRELAWLFEGAKARVLSVTGGSDPREESRRLARGAEIVVATPGRLVDHLTRKNIDLSALQVVVLDEADEMLDLGFREELETILGAAPKERRTHMFSATLPAGIRKLATTWQREAAHVAAGVEAGGAAGQNPDIEFVAHLHGSGEREAAVVNVLLFHDAPAAIVFTRTRATAAELAVALARRGFHAVSISGDLSQAERTRALASLREGRARVLVATDVAARGLDLPDVALVVHADPPAEASALTHRSGRTGRAGRKGTSVVLAPRGLRAGIERLFHQAKIRGEWTPVPGAAEIRAAAAERLVAQLKSDAREPQGDEGVFIDRLLHEVPVRDLVAALVRRSAGSMPEPATVHAAPAPAAAERRGARGEAAPAGRGAREGGPRARRGGREEGGPPRPPPRDDRFVAFRVNVGRERNAEPRWLLPMICRRGDITGADVGAIDIRPRSTTFQIRKEKAAAFEKAASRIDPAEPKVRFERELSPDELAARPRPERAPRAPHAGGAKRPTSSAPRPMHAVRPKRNRAPESRPPRAPRAPAGYDED